MKPFLLAGVVVVAIPVALSLVLTIIMLMVLVGLWSTRSYWVPRVMYHGITLIAGCIGLWVAYETYYAPSRKFVAGDLIFFVTAELAMAGVLLWWHHQSWMVQAAEMWFFDRRHERHQRASLAFDLRR